MDYDVYGRLYAVEFTTTEIPKGSPLWQGVRGDSLQCREMSRSDRGYGAVSPESPAKVADSGIIFENLSASFRQFGKMPKNKGNSFFLLTFWT